MAEPTREFQTIAAGLLVGKTIRSIAPCEDGGIRLFFGSGQWVQFSAKSYDGMPVLGIAYPEQSTIEINECDVRVSQAGE